MSASYPVEPNSDALFDWKAWKFLALFYRGRWTSFLLFVAAGGVQALLLLPPLYLVRKVFDVAIPKGDAGLLIWLGVGIFASRALAGCAAIATRSLGLDITRSATADMRCDLLSTLSVLSREYYGQTDPDRLHSRIVQDCERVENISSNLISLVPIGQAALALVAGLLWLNWRLSLLLVVATPVMWIAFAWSGRRTKRAVRAFQGTFEDVSKGIRFLLSHVDLIRLRGFEGGEQERQQCAVEKLRKTGKRMAMAFALHGQMQTNLTGLAAVIILVGGGLAIQSGMMSLGAFLAFFVASNLLMSSVDRIAAAMPELIVGNESLLTIMTIHFSGPREPYQGTAKPRFSGEISVRNVDFSHAGTPILRSLSVDLQPSTITAIVGPNGCGKTTLVNLILGFYRPDHGDILADGLPYDAIDMRTLRRSIGVVPQQPTFFAGTVIENIGFGLPLLEREDMIAAAKRADADKFIRSLPQGYDTMIGEGGTRLSGGEAQKLAIARALLGHPKLLILDEPTNHLDAPAMLRILNVLLGDRDGPTILIVSHDPQIVRFADQTYRIEAGGLVLEMARRLESVAP